MNEHGRFTASCNFYSVLHMLMVLLGIKSSLLHNRSSSFSCVASTHQQPSKFPSWMHAVWSVSIKAIWRLWCPFSNYISYQAYVSARPLTASFDRLHMNEHQRHDSPEKKVLGDLMAQIGNRSRTCHFKVCHKSRHGQFWARTYLHASQDSSDQQLSRFLSGYNRSGSPSGRRLHRYFCFRLTHD